MMAALDVVVKVVPVLVKSYCVVESGVKIYELSQKEVLDDNEKMQLCTEIAFTIFQSFDLLAAGSGILMKEVTFLKKIQLMTSGGSGVMHITKEMIPHFAEKKKWNLNDIGDIAGIILFRLTDFATVGAAYPNCSCDVQEGLDKTANLAKCAEAVLLAYRKRGGMSKAANAIMKWSTLAFQRRQPPTSCPQEPTVPVFVLPNNFQMNQINEEQVDQAFDNLYQSIFNWQHLEYIPTEVTAAEPMFKKFKCQITDKCIRFVICPKGSHRIYYEKKELHKWLLNSQTNPPGWPSHVTFEKSNFRKNEIVQDLINDALKTIAEEWRTLREKDGLNQ